MSQDEKQLRLLSIFHYVVGGLAGLFVLYPVIMFVMILPYIGMMMPEPSRGIPDPFGWLYALMGAVIILAGLAMAASIILAGRFLTRRTHYTYCLVIAGIECMFMPFGTVLGVFTIVECIFMPFSTVLGVFTIVVLMRESVKPLFQESPPTEPWHTEADDPTSSAR